jgi:cytidine deaminase
MQRESLLARARAAAERAYAPYSGFRVGAAVVAAGPDGARVVTGANVESASFGLTLCAERAALAAALTSESQAMRGPLRHANGTAPRPRITHVAIACIDVAPDAPAAQRTPCGACRQWLAELAPDATYYIEGIPGALHLEDLLPLAFRLGNAPLP